MLRVELKPSRQLATLLIVAHVAAIVLVWLIPVPAWLAISATLGLCCALAYYVYAVALLRAARAVVALELADDGEAAARRRDGDWTPVAVAGSTFAMPWLTVVNLDRPDGRRFGTVVILSDTLAPADFRRLRVWLRFRYAGPVDHTT